LDTIRVFTTRPDTIYGATFLVLAPEHKLLNKLNLPKDVQNYIKKAEQKSEIDRMETEREKTGVSTGFDAINPATGEKIPIWVADYVLPGYGTGAIMAVPAHDERDLDFTKKFNLPIRVVVKAQKDYDNVDQNALKDFTKELFKLAKKNEFTMVLVGGTADSLVKSGRFGKHSDIDVFVDQKGLDILKKHFAERKLKSATRNGHSGIHSWNNHAWYWGDGVWVDLFLLEQENGTYFDNIGKEKYVWGNTEALQSLEFEGVQIVAPSEKILADIEFNLSHNWNYCFTDEGILTHSGKYDGLGSAEARERMTKEFGKERVNYKIRDWLISRQRYWGVPIPVIHCPQHGFF
ncbi:hypothetical protein BVY01_01040, partial [bacterium I07]